MQRSHALSAFVAACCCSARAAGVTPCSPTRSCPIRRRKRGRATLSRELRCMVCQNQSIDDSEAPLARDLRLLVRERIAAGDSDAQVLDFLVARYGEFVLLKPRFERQTLLLWLLPPLVLFGGGLALWRHSEPAPRKQAAARMSAARAARRAEDEGAARGV